MANRLQIPLEGYSNPNFTFPEPGTQPSRGNVQARPDFIRTNGGPPPGTMPGGGPDVTDAEFRNAKPIGGSPQTIKPVPSSGGGRYYDAARAAGAKVGDTVRAVAGNPVVRGAGKVLAAADAANQGLQAVDHFQGGDNVMGGYHAIRAATSVGAANGNPVAMAAAGGLAAGDALYNHGLSEDTKGSIGSGLNKIVRGVGKTFGQDWGVDPTKGDAATFGGGSTPSPTASPKTNTPTSPDGGIPLGSQNPLRVLERNAGIANPGSAPPTQAPNLKFGEASAPGTFGNGYTDLGGGIGGKGSGSRGQPNDFTNIGADGKPTALSQGDSRTPDQIANGEKIKAQTAATVAAAGGLGNLQRQNALMAANIRDGVDPHRGFNGPQVSIMQNTSGSGRGQSGGGKDDLASLVKSLKGSGIKVSHNTLRSIIAAQSQQQAAQIQANASMYGHDSTSRTQLATNANTVAAQREGNQLQAESSKYGHDVTAQGNRIRQAFEQKKFGIEQGWKQVDHNRAVGNDTRQAREHGEKMFNESVGRMFPGQEGAADAAAFTKAAHHTIANHVNNLRKSGSPEAMAKAQEIEANPWSSEMMSRLAQGYQVRKTSAANHGNWGTPGSGKHVESDDLFSYTADPTRKTDKGMFDNEVPLRNGGTISENAAMGTSAIKNAFGYGQRTQDQINYINQR